MGVRRVLRAGGKGADVHPFGCAVGFINRRCQKRAVAGKNGQIDARFFQGRGQIGGFDFVARVEEGIHRAALQLGQHWRVVALAFRHLHTQGFHPAQLSQCIGQGSGQPLPVVRVVVDHSHIAGVHLLHQKLGVHLRLHPVIGVDAEKLRVASIGQAFFRGSRGDSNQPQAIVVAQGGVGLAAVQVADDTQHPLAAVHGAADFVHIRHSGVAV